MPILDKRKIKHNAVVYEKKCASCGITFYAKRPKGIYCSDLCRCHAYLKRKEKQDPDTAIKNEKLYFNSKRELSDHLKNLGYKKDFYNNFTWRVGEKCGFRVGLQRYIIERISHKEYTFQNDEKV